MLLAGYSKFLEYKYTEIARVTTKQAKHVRNALRIIFLQNVEIDHLNRNEISR